MEIQTSPIGEVVFGSTVGASHIKENKPCQDAVSVKEGTYRGKPYLICSTADGHGDPKYKYSDVGAVMANLAAEKTMTHLLFVLRELSEGRGDAFSSYLKEFLKNEWKENIRQLWRVFRLDEELAKKHGSTILSVLIYDGFAYMAQLGDGDICYLDKDNNPVFLLEPDAGPVSFETESLCSKDASECWNFACIPAKDIRFLMMSTDGLINSLASNDQYVKFALSVRDYLKKFRPFEINSVLPEWLSEYSHSGCEDDISLVAINLESEKNKTGDEDETEVGSARAGSSKKVSGRRSGGNFYCQTRRKAFRAKGVQRVKRYPRSEKYYLLSGRRRHSLRKLCG